MKKLIFLGASGNASVINSTIEDINQKKIKIKPIGFLDDEKNSFNRLKFFGKIKKETVQELLIDKNIFFIWTLISSKLREKTLEKLKNLKIPNNRFLSIIHPTANISKFANIGIGVSIHPFANIGPNVTVANHVHIYSYGLIGHDAKIGNYSYIAAKSTIGAYVTVEEGCFFGINSCVRENLIIKSWATVGMGAVVINDVKKKQTVVGNPAKKISKN